jgi:hypothetical protein
MLSLARRVNVAGVLTGVFSRPFLAGLFSSRGLADIPDPHSKALLHSTIAARYCRALLQRQ